MKIKILSFILFFSAFQLSSFAGPIYDAYKKIEQQIFSMDDDPVKKSQQLRDTLLKSLKSALVKFYNYQNYEDVVASEMTYELAQETKNAYYVKYKNFFAYFTYRQDPKLYYVSALEQKIVTNPEVDIPRFEVVVDDWGQNKKNKKQQKETEGKTGNKN